MSILIFSPDVSGPNIYLGYPTKALMLLSWEGIFKYGKENNVRVGDLLGRRFHFCHHDETSGISAFFKDFEGVNTLILFARIADPVEIFARMVLEGRQIGGFSEAEQAARELWGLFESEILTGIDDLIRLPSFPEALKSSSMEALKDGIQVIRDNPIPPEE